MPDDSGARWMRSSTRIQPLVSEPRWPRGLLDTSVVIDLERIAEAALPDQVAISSLTLADLAAGPHATSDLDERARRQERLQRAETTFDPLPFDAAAARAYGVLYAAVVSGGRKARGRRAIDILIAAVARGNDLPLFTRNPADFAGLEALVEIVPVER